MSEFKAKYKKNKELSPFSVVAISYIFELILFIAILSVISFIITKNHTEAGIMQLYVILDSAVVAFVMSALCSNKIVTKKLIFGMLVSIAAGITEFLIIMCFNSAQLVWQAYIILPAVIIAALAGCITGSNIRRK